MVILTDLVPFQENPEDVPHGEMPRHLQLYCDRYLTDKVFPGCRVTVVGVFSIRRLQAKGVRFFRSSVGSKMVFGSGFLVQIQSV